VRRAQIPPWEFQFKCSDVPLPILHQLGSLARG
jgi:hypothetical protein